MNHKPDLKDTFVLGKSGTGKTTQLIAMLKALLEQYPDLKIGVCEKVPDIATAIQKVLPISTPSEDFDLLVVNSVSDTQLMKKAFTLNIPVWCEICSGESTLPFIEEIVGKDILGVGNIPLQVIYMDSFAPSILL